MELGFVSAILPDLDLRQVVALARDEGFSCVELMCWPRGKAERRYAGVTHIDVDDLGPAQADEVRSIVEGAGVRISGLGYYPNPLVADEAESRYYVERLRRTIVAAERLGTKVVNTFVGRDPARTVEAQWPRFVEVWRPLAEFAAERGVRIGIENCPMLYTADEWPGGKNLAYCPAVWRRIFAEIAGPGLALNYDPSHLVWQQIDYVKPLAEFADRIAHVHLKDAKVDRRRLDDVGILATPLEYHDPKLPGRGDVDWARFLGGLEAIGYRGAACIEVEDREFEGSLEARREALRQSAAHLRGVWRGFR